MLIFGLAGDADRFDPLLLLVLALVLEAASGGLFGGRDGRWGAAFRLGSFIRTLERKLNRDRRSPIDRAVRGFLLVLALVLAGAVLGWVVAWLTRNHDFGWLVELVLLWALLGQGRGYRRAKAVGTALNAGDPEEARRVLEPLVRRDPARMDSHGVARAAIEWTARAFCVEAVAPVFWYVLFGFPGFLVHRVVRVLDDEIGHPTPHYRAFGMTAARLDDILNLIPARLSALFFIIAAIFVPAARPGASWHIAWRDAGRHRSMNAGWPAAAMAGALGITLAGPRRRAEGATDEAWIGTGTARATDRDLGRALYLYAVAGLINLAWLVGLAILGLSGRL
jgi:adenosylcobinamide-phosphate synthase